MELFAYIFAWVMGAIVVGLFAGLVIGRMAGQRQPPPLDAQQQAQQLTMQTLLELAPQMAKLSSVVEGRNSAIREVHRHVGDMKIAQELEEPRQELMGQIAQLLESNQRLTEDLEYAQLRIDQQTEELDRTRREARTDALSGLSNRKAFDQRLRMLLSIWKREHIPFALILADLDHLKWINDTHGHVSGDRVIQQFGKLVQTRMREGDFLARYGGDEFAALLPRTELAVALDIAERVRVDIAKATFAVGLRSQRIAVTFSCGVAAPQVNDTPEALLQRADKALYRSKHGGRNRVQAQHEPDDVSIRDTAIIPLTHGIGVA